MKFQQYTGPVQAKGLEDTAFYRYNVLLSLNEVGGDPVAVRPHRPKSSTRRTPRAAADVAVRDARHRHARHQARRRRARADQRAVGDARRVGPRGRALDAAQPQAYRTVVDGEPAPDRDDEYRFYQALVGVWPPDVPADATDGTRRPRRAACASLHDQGRQGGQSAYQLADARIRPYEDALVTTFVAGRCPVQRARRFLSAFLPFQARVASLGMVQLARAGRR